MRLNEGTARDIVSILVLSRKPMKDISKRFNLTRPELWMLMITYLLTSDNFYTTLEEMREFYGGEFDHVLANIRRKHLLQFEEMTMHHEVGSTKTIVRMSSRAHVIILSLIEQVECLSHLINPQTQSMLSLINEKDMRRMGKDPLEDWAKKTA